MRRAYILTIIVALIAALAAGCGNSAAKGEGGLAEKKQQLQEKEAKLKELNAEIKTLREEIAELDTTTEEFSGRYVTAMTVKPEEFVHKIEIQGTADSDENVSVTTEMGGTVEQVHVTEGQKVSKGQLLLSLDDDVIRKQIGEIEVGLDLATTTFEKQKRLWEQNIGSEMQFLQAKNQKESLESKLKSAQAQLAKMNVTSPINGVVDQLNINAGELASPGRQLLRVVDLSKIEIHADASESYLTAIREGEPVNVRFPAIGVTRQAEIKYVGSVIDPTNRTFGVEIDLNNKSGELKANLLAIIEIEDYVNDSALVVPTKYIQQQMDKDAVFVVATEDGKKVGRRREVKIGKTYNGNTEVLEGLKVGDVVVAEGSRDLANGEEIIIKKD